MADAKTYIDRFEKSSAQLETLHKAGRDLDQFQQLYLEQRERANILQGHLIKARAHQRQHDRPRTHLVIPDPHAHPDHSNRRFDALGNWIVAHKPEVIINLGDTADLPSLSRFDVGKRSSHGRALADDVEVSRDAFRRMSAPLIKYNKRRKVKYEPIRIALDGNHEDRIDRAVNDNPALYGTISIDQLGSAECGWERIPYLVPYVIDGICYKHYHVSGVMGRSISGENPAKSLLVKGLMSCVSGHSHLFDHSERTRADGEKIFGLHAGCFFEHTDPWAGAVGKIYWRGLVVLKDVQGGYHQGGMKQIAMEDLLAEYL